MSHSHPYGDRAARHAAELSQREESLLAAGHGRRVSVAPLASVLLVAVGAWVLLAKYVLSLPYSEPSWDTALRDEMLAAVVVLAGLRLCWRARSTTATVLAVLAGLGLLVLGLFTHHGVERAAISETVSGAAVVVVALAARLAP